MIGYLFIVTANRKVYEEGAKNHRCLEFVWIRICPNRALRVHISSLRR